MPSSVRSCSSTSTGSPSASASAARLYFRQMHTASGVYMLPCEEERYTAWGDLLMRAGLRFKQSFTGTGYNEDVRLMPDFSGRLYALKAGAGTLPGEKQSKNE